MPQINPKQPGDNAWPQYNRIIKVPIGTGAITKGHLYTLNDEGYLVSAGATRSNFSRGLYQAVDSVPASTTAGENRVQCLCPGSRVLLKGPVDLVNGDLVEYTGTTNILKKLTLTASMTSADFFAKVGRVFEIYTNESLGVIKLKSAADDVMTVELGQG